MSDAGLNPARETPGAERDVESMLLRAAYDRLPLSLLMTVVVTLMFVGLLWPYFPPAQMTTWLVAILAVVAVRFLQWAGFRHAAPAPDALGRWRTHYLVGSTLAGAAWSLGPALMMPEATGAQSALFVGALLSVCAVAVSTQSSQRHAMQAFLAAALAPAAIAAWRTGGDVERTLSLVLFAGLVSLIVVGRRSGQVTRELIETQARLQSIIETEPECIKIVDAKGCVAQMNPAGLAMVEADSLEQVVGRPVIDVIAPEYRQAYLEMHRRVLAGEPAQMTYEVVGLKGTRRWLETHAVPMLDNGETVQLGVTRDITDRRQTEEALKESERLLSESQHVAGLGSYVLDCTTGLWKSSRVFDRLFGIGEAYERTVDGWAALLHPEDRATMLAYFRDEVLAEGRPFDKTYRIVRRNDGAERWVHGLGELKFDDEGRPLRMHGSIQDITERKQAESALSQSEAKLRGLYELSPLGIALTDMKGRFVEFNDAFQKICGYSASELKALDYWALTPKKYEADEARQLASLANDGQYGPYEKEYVRNDGSLVPLRLNGLLIVGADGEEYIWSIVEDITLRKQAEKDLRVAATAFESQEGMLITDAGKTIVRVNRAFSDITGYAAEEAVGRTPKLLSSGRHDAEFYKAMYDSIARTGSWRGEIWNRRKNGEVYPGWLAITAVKDEQDEVTHYVATLTDISARKMAEDEIRNLAFSDSLTGLPNRRLLLDRLKQALASTTRNARSGALLFIDLDDFKTLNDTLGHEMGDQLLIQVGQRLTTCVREGDTVARLGGDEFVVMLEDLDEDLKQAAAQARMVGEKILATLNHPYQIGRYEHHSTPSIGITLFRGHDNSVDELLRQTDLAMYQAKAAGRNTLRFYDQEMQAEVTTRVALEAHLREAVQKNQFLLYYQPQVVGGGRVTGAEALLRWRHPERGIVYPGEFISLAEDTGLILPLGNWVLETACIQLERWAARPQTSHLTLAVNVSARQFRHRDFVAQLLSTLDRSGADPRRLKLELTESLLVDDVEDVIAKMNALKVKGVGFSLDDFGTGYSSLSYLKRLPLDQLKIDQSFVRDILSDPNDAAIAKMVIALAESLGLTVIAEGVELEAQRDFLARQGCHAYQGYLFSRPQPLEDFEKFAVRI